MRTIYGSSRRRRHGFNTVELMVGISIIAMLAGVTFVGLRVVGTGAKVRATRTALATAEGMMAEVQVARGMPYVRAVYTSPPNNATRYASAFQPLKAGALAPTPVPAPADGSLGGNLSEERYFNVRFASVAIVRTQMVVQRLLAVSANRSVWQQLPSGSFMGWNSRLAPPAGLPGKALQFRQTRVGPGAKFAWSPPLLVDAWDNPIIYVPPAGMSGVTFAERPAVKRVVTSVRVRDDYKAGDRFEPGAVGFWASAGPDADFTKGDDNLYSFEGP
jgi:type II secretory pathway pseudopilin PulG